MYKAWYIMVDKLPTSTGDRRISEPSTAIINLPLGSKGLMYIYIYLFIYLHEWLIFYGKIRR